MRSRVGEIAGVFLRLGATAFGGPAAHIALMRRELVESRRWEDERTFLDLVGLTSLLPGPNSTELAIEMGRRRGGRAGLVTAGICFILPAALLVTALAWCYQRYETTPALADLRRGILPVVVAIIAHAVFKLGHRAVGSAVAAGIAVAACAGFLLGVHELVLLVAGAAVTFAWHHRARLRPSVVLVLALAPTSAGDGAPVGPAGLFWSFLRIGATLFGSGYVLVAMLEREFVERLAVLSPTQLLDAIAVGQVTPGPVFTTATFIGFLLDGAPGAVVASVAIFLPAFLLVALLGGRFEAWLRRDDARALLDGLNAAAVGLLAAAAVSLVGDAVTDWVSGLIAAAALALLVIRNVDPTALIAGGLTVGAAYAVAG